MPHGVVHGRRTTKLTHAMTETDSTSPQGILPNDVDCDSFIESTDYGHGGMTVKELDAEMEDRGYPPNA